VRPGKPWRGRPRSSTRRAGAETITAINPSAFLALAGRRVPLVDMDPQGHSTLGLPGGEGTPARTMSDVLLNRIGGSDTTISDVTRTVGQNFDLAPADILLSAVQGHGRLPPASDSRV
jgi:chromosome partitioning protein